MKVLIIEDDELKHSHLEKFILLELPHSKIRWCRSYHSGLQEVLTNQYDLVLLDMSMHIYEKTSEENGGSFETYAGRLILAEMEINDVEAKVIVITGYDMYGDGKTLKTLKAELREEFTEFYLDTVYFVSNQDKWKNEIGILINRFLKNNE